MEIKIEDEDVVLYGGAALIGLLLGAILRDLKGRPLAKP